MISDQNDSVSAKIGRYQLSLWNLLTIVTVFAVVLGLCRISNRMFFLTVMGSSVALPTIWRPRWFFTWYLPAIWTCVARLNFEYPGDEYGGFGVGSMAGFWIVFMVDFTNGQNPRDILPTVLVTGVITMTVVGVLLDKIRVRWLPWSILWLGLAMALFQWSIGSYESVERALSKNGSYEAYVLPSLNIGLYGATLVMLFGTGLWRLIRWSRLGKLPP